MRYAEERLKSVKSDLVAGKESPKVTTRTFLSWFGAQRRGYNIVTIIRKALHSTDLVTKPDFESAYIDAEIAFALRSDVKEAKPDRKKAQDASNPASFTKASVDPVAEAAQDPTYRVSKLAAANQKVVRVSPDTSLTEAITLMMIHDFSQLPVMTSDRDVKGVISWKSIGERVGLGVKGPAVRDYMDGYEEVSHDASMFDVISQIIASDFVIVRLSNKTVSGIITASDLSLQFKSLAEPFLLLSEIENLLRSLIGDRFTPEEMKVACDPSDTSREVAGVSDMNFGEYIRLLENEARWQKFSVPMDRTLFCRRLDDVRRIRNDVMHFDPDGISDEDLDILRDFSRFIKKISSLRSGK